MPTISAGLLMYRFTRGVLQVFLIHPGGPFWSNRDLGSWSIPKGVVGTSEDTVSAAKREFMEETGMEASGLMIPLNPLKQRSGKVVYAWAFRGDGDPSQLRSNTFTMEWPPRSGKLQEFPEADRADWFDIGEAKSRILPGQLGFLVQLEAILREGHGENR